MREWKTWRNTEVAMNKLNVNEVLTNQDQEMISDWIAQYGMLYSDVKSSPAPLDYVLRFWAQAKAPFYKMFGERLDISKRINYNASIHDLRYELQKSMTATMDEFFINLSHALRYDNVIGHAMRAAGLNEYLFYVNDLQDMLIKNRWEYSDVKIPLENGKFFTIKTGMRVTRAFQKMAEIMSIPGFEAIRELHAKISTAKVIQGTLHLTIHPLDYITMSDNEEGWDSCMNWRNQGDYRAGTVEMMNSPFVIEAYIESAKNRLQVGRYEWNSKMWRELYIVTPDFISNIRAYPFIDSNLSKIVIDWIRELAEKSSFGHYRKEIDTYGDDTESTPYVNDNNISLHMETNNMYNDYCREPQHIIFREGFAEKWNGLTYYLNYSGAMVCMNCGYEMDSSMEETRAVMCCSCSDSEDEKWVCDFCGDTVYNEDDLYIVDDTYLCYNCYNDPETCCVAYDDQESHLVNNCTRVYLGNPNVGNYIYLYDKSWWLRHNDDGIDVSKIKYVNIRPDAPWANEQYMIPLQYVSEQMAYELGFRSREDLTAMYENYTDKYEEVEFPTWRWGA